jgi:hypothetical protein
MFIDNIYRFTLAGTECSALGRDAVRRWATADAGRGNGPAAGADHVDEDRLDHVDPGGVRSRPTT